MIVIDSSAVLAILFQEAEALTCSSAIERAGARLISAVAVLEAGIVILSRRGQAGHGYFDDFLVAAGIAIVPFDAEQAHLARDAFARYGKGRHAAALNFGDCAAYALARSHAAPLLYKGKDFSLTDVVSAIP